MLAIVRAHLDEPVVAPGETTLIDEVDGWDSVIHVQIIVAIEAHFAVRFDPEEYMDFAMIGEIVDCVAGKLARGKAAGPAVQPAAACSPD